jgi:MobA/MobL family
VNIVAVTSSTRALIPGDDIGSSLRAHAGAHARGLPMDGPMSIMFLNVRSVSRGRGGSAVAKAAYIAREKLHDTRLDKKHDYRAVTGLRHSEILLPAGTAPESGAWARDRERLWNAAEAAETRRNARVGREYVVSLPHELPHETRVALAKAFAQTIADRHGAVVDLAVHGPTPRGDARNHHAHVLATTREFANEGLGRKTSMELNNDARRERGLPTSRVEFRELRVIWADLANEQLRLAKLEMRLEPRSKATIEREMLRLAAPTPPAAGAHQAVAQVALTPDTVSPVAAAVPAPRLPEERRRTMEEEQQLAITRWRAYRAAKEAGLAPEPSRERGRERGLDAGLEL